MTPLEEVAPIHDVPVGISVELDRRMLKIRDILDLQPGSIVELPRSAGENIDIYIGGKLIGSGEIVIIENSMGVRITNFRIED
jgi:flagellar motor switch protein FliN